MFGLTLSICPFPMDSLIYTQKWKFKIAKIFSNVNILLIHYRSLRLSTLPYYCRVLAVSLYIRWIFRVRLINNDLKYMFNYSHLYVLNVTLYVTLLVISNHFSHYSAKSFNHGNDNDDKKHSSPTCDCPTPCRRTTYDTSISYAFSSEFDAAMFLNTENITYLSRHFVKVRMDTIYFELFVQNVTLSSWIHLKKSTNMY